MGIEKISFIEITGNVEILDDVLENCLYSAVFQQENVSSLSEYSVGSSPLMRNPYGGLLVKINEISTNLEIPLGYEDFSKLEFKSTSRNEFVSESHEYLNNLRLEYPKYFDDKNKINEELSSFTSALEMLTKIKKPDIDFDKLFSGSFIKVRFGKIPKSGLEKLKVYQNKPYALYELSKESNYTWCIYITAQQFAADIDALLKDVGFIRIRLPDYIHGRATDAISYVKSGLESEREHAKLVSKEIDEFILREKKILLMVYSKAKFYYDAYDLRKNAVTMHNKFHIVGFVPTKKEKHFVSQFDNVKDCEIRIVPARGDGRLQTPVMLKNNWFAKPFEMFVNMYGSPSYNDIDPTPFVAYTYSILFGIMFGDVGQGLLILLIGLYLSKKRGMDLGGIMSRIGFSSMIFGGIYGSVFGFEHLLDPFYKMLGFHEKPIEIMRPETTNTILLTAVGLGVAIILMVIIFNICIGIKQKDISRIFFSHNGVSGLVFYSAGIYAGVSSVMGNSVLSSWYIFFFFVIPIIFIFFAEPVKHIIKMQTTDFQLHKSKTLMDSFNLKKLNSDIPQLFTTQFLSARFGRIPTDSYPKLQFYTNEPFVLYPLKLDNDYIWCIYAMATSNKPEIDAIFEDLYFERIFIPDEFLTDNDQAELFIQSCIDSGSTSYKTAVAVQEHKTISHSRAIINKIFPDGIGSFITESFFELFEVLLSYVTNTMSFLRVGGFILSHAGMMSVVFTLSGMVSAGASPFVIVFGNLFVMALEGLIVGIQALRLEFYEMFSRFFDAQGTTFKPETVNYANKSA